MEGKDFTTVDYLNEETGEHRIVVSDGLGTNLVISSFGATITNFYLKNAIGENAIPEATVQPKDIVLGFDKLEEYQA